MYQLIRKLGLRKILLVESPALIVALAMAELLYKFGSFTLEFLAALVTWYVFSSLFSFMARCTRSMSITSRQEG